ncbi:MAG TPA: SEC-C metal-binding domain-containing protein, partial [bacterium]
AQRKVEQYHFDVRKHVLEYDDVMNVQRKLIYSERRKVLAGEEIRDNILDMVERLVERTVDAHCPGGTHPEEWDLDGLAESAAQLAPALADVGVAADRSSEELKDALTSAALAVYEKKAGEVGEDFPTIERLVLLQTIDRKWIDHLYNMEALREGIGLRAYAQVSPLVEYQREGYALFQQMMDAVQEETVQFLFRVQVESEPSGARPVARALHAGGPGGSGRSARTSTATAATPAESRKIGRNDPCWCGSGKKYKKCHGKDE